MKAALPTEVASVVVKDAKTSPALIVVRP